MFDSFPNIMVLTGPILLLVLALLIFWLWTIIHCLVSNMTGLQKLVWVASMIIMPIIGNILYIILITKKESKFTMGKQKRLLRTEDGKIIAGICAGTGKYFDVDPVLVRVLVLLLMIVSIGSVLLVYLIAWIIIPHESQLIKRKK